MDSVKTLLTPKELADAIGASESSVRRWVDAGGARMSRTAGGHRRIPLAEAVRFIRESGATVVRPDLLGLADLGGATDRPLGVTPDDALFEALRAGDRRLARGLIVSAYLDGRTLAAIFDGPVRAAMHRVGELWKHDERGILVEHRATAICLDAVAQLREFLRPPAEHAPLALGGAPAGDPYLIPSTMAALVVADAGFRDVNFGANTPVELLAGEAVAQRARLVWLSISTEQDPRPLRAQIDAAASALAARGIEFVFGGLRADDYAPRARPNVHQIHSMSELAAFARGLATAKSGIKPVRTKR